MELYETMCSSIQYQDLLPSLDYTYQMLLQEERLQSLLITHVNEVDIGTFFVAFGSPTAPEIKLLCFP